MTTATVPHTLTARGDVWEVRVTANDGFVDGAEGTASVTIGNAAPSCDAASIFPSAAGTDEDLACSCGDWSDPDGDAAADRCAFFDGTEPIEGADGGCTLPADLTERGMDVRCVYTPSDGSDDGNARESGAVPILNGAPSIPGVALTPDAANALTEFSCTLGEPSVDPDGDSIFYAVAWLVDGYENPGVATPTAPTAAASAASPSAATSRARSSRSSSTIAP